MLISLSTGGPLAPSSNITSWKAMAPTTQLAAWPSRELWPAMDQSTISIHTSRWISLLSRGLRRSTSIGPSAGLNAPAEQSLLQITSMLGLLLDWVSARITTRLSALRDTRAVDRRPSPFHKRVKALQWLHAKCSLALANLYWKGYSMGLLSLIVVRRWNDTLLRGTRTLYCL